MKKKRHFQAQIISHRIAGWATTETWLWQEGNETPFLPREMGELYNRCFVLILKCN